MAKRKKIIHAKNLGIVFLLFASLIAFLIFYITRNISLPSSQKKISPVAIHDNRAPVIINSNRDGEYLIQANIGEVANVFSWGFNRHLCYDETHQTWWVFYYTLDERKRPGWIVYRYSTDQGKKWSKEVRLSSLDDDAADFTINCEPPFISTAYGDNNQSSIYWKKGKMNNAKIDWEVASTPFKSTKSYTHVIPSIVYIDGVPAVSSHDQSEQGPESGHKRAYVVLANDKDGKTWMQETKVYDEKKEKDTGTLAFISLVIVHDKLYALINSNNYNMYQVEYLSKNTWSNPILINNFLYGGGTPEWTTITDNNGDLHVVYPEQLSRRVRHAVFDGEKWKFESIANFPNIELNQLTSSVDKDGVVYIIGGVNKIIGWKVNDVWQFSDILKVKNPQNTNFLNSTQFMTANKLGIAWVEGEYTNSHAWFACIEKSASSSATQIYLQKCK